MQKYIYEMDLACLIDLSLHLYTVMQIHALQGDVIGCYLHMPEGGRAFEKAKSVSSSG